MLTSHSLDALQTLVRRGSSRVSKLIMYARLKKAQVPQAKTIPTYTTPEELRALYALAASCPPNAVALEIGSYLGASTCYLAIGLAKNSGSLLCVDTWQNETMPEGERDTWAEFERNTKGVANTLKVIRKNSDDLMGTDITSPLHLVFIDGDHSYEAARGDFERIVPWLDDKGIIAFHDCVAFEGVSRVIGEALATGNWQIAGYVGNLLWIKRPQWTE